MTVENYQAQKVDSIEFSSEFSALNTEGREVDNAADIGSVMATVNRLAVNVGGQLKLGSINKFHSWGDGKGFNYSHEKESVNYEAYEDITEWVELDSSLAGRSDDKKNFDSQIPLFPSRLDIQRYLNDLKIVSWFGIMNGSNKTWQHNFKNFITERNLITQVCKSIFQMDIILKTQVYPRSRLSASYDNGRIWVWVNNKNDYLVVCTAKSRQSISYLPVIELGEAFYISN